MKINPKIARMLYFAIQGIRKEPVRAELNILNNEFFDSEKAIRERVWRRGRETLLFALEHVYFYRKNCSEGLKKDVLWIKSYDEFCDVITKFPIIDKQTFIKNKKEFQSDQFSKMPGYKTYSSGSTGEPVAFERDQADWARAHANLIKILDLFKVKYGAPHIYYWAGDWTLVSRLSNCIRDFIFNRKRFTVYKNTLNDLSSQVDIIHKYKPAYIYGLPSGITRLSQYIISNNSDLKKLGIQAVFTTGESLSLKSKEIIEKAFGAPVCDIYGCSEVGLIAFDCPKGKKHALIDTNFTEVVENNSIVVTNLYQRKSVVIRYKVGDLVDSKLSYQKCDCGVYFPVFGGISGRESKDIILPNGKQIPYMAIAYIFDRVIFDGSVIEGRFVLNEDGDLFLYLVPGLNFAKEAANILKTEAKALFGMDAKVKIVEDIPVAPGGKKVDFLNEWNC